jgi:hypothetical protein
VDFVQWTGPSPDQDPSNWQRIDYKHDVAGRRVEKKVDGYSTRYVHDGGHVIAEYFCRHMSSESHTTSLSGVRLDELG